MLSECIIQLMNNKALPPPILIERQDEFLRLIPRLKSESRLALDTESNSLYVYREQVCLIQISTVEQDYLIDPLRLEDMNPLRSLLEAVEIEKVLHGAEYDVLCLKRDFGFRIANLFDTRVALRTLGKEPTGLGDVIEQEFGVSTNKRWQRANWGRRPLAQELLDYARMDSHYLLLLRERLGKELRSQGRWQEAREECELIALSEPAENHFHANQFWKIRNALQLTPAQAAILREIFLWREGHAQRENRPPFKVMGNSTLLAIAEEIPINLEELQRIPGLTPSQSQRYGHDLLAAVARGKKAPPPARPKPERHSEIITIRYQRLKKWRKRMASKRKVDSDIILPRDLVWEIAQKAPDTNEELHRLMKPLEWRFRQYGEEILRVIHS
jgi:ribonuclease D